MTRSNHSKRFAVAALSVAALTIAVPVAQAQSPDAFERAAQSQERQTPTFVGSPDAIDRAIAARQAQSMLRALEIRERALTERSGATTTVAPDAFERALVTHADGLTAQTVSMLDSRERALVGRPTPSQPVAVTSGGFDWSDFGVGAGAGIGLMLVLLGLGAGLPAFRRDDSRATTA
jgi:hypothetical protein